MVRVAVDAMGGDNAPGEIVEGARQAALERKDISVILVGDGDRIRGELKNLGGMPDNISVVETTEEIEMAEPPVMAIRRKKDSSMVVGLNLVKNGEADAFCSAGNSGAVLAGGTLLVGRIRGVERPPLAPLIPTDTKAGVSLLVDCGANVDARPSHLVQFAQMGSVYMEHVCGVANPRVAIVNIGAEEEKGNALVKETFPLLKACEGIHFIGSIEARDIPSGYADVIVTEAFTGNVILKLYEGLGKSFLHKIKAGFTASLTSKVGAALAASSLKRELQAFDVTRYGGAPLLGLNGLVVKTHGSAHAIEVKNTIFQCALFHEQEINHRIQEKLFAQESCAEEGSAKT